jgi:archaellum component FlaC
MALTGIQLTYKLDEESATILVRILGKLVAIEGTLMSMNDKIAQLSQKMSDLGTTVEAVLAKVQALKAGAGDETAVQGLIEQVDALNTALQAVVVQAP